MSSEVYSEPLESFPCPDVPGPDYPPEWPLLDLLGNWNPGNASAVPPRHFLGVCRYANAAAFKSDRVRRVHPLNLYFFWDPIG